MLCAEDLAFLEVSLSTDPGKFPTLEDAEKALILRAIRVSKGNRKEAAVLLGIPRSTFYSKLKHFDISE